MSNAVKDRIGNNLPKPELAAGTAPRFGTLERPTYSERCRLDLPGFKNLEGLYIGR
ncbi:MAG: hypothetical protein ACXWT4_03445 [Methylobacter sp.]